jgi:integrase
MPRTSNKVIRRSDGRFEARATFDGKRRSFFGSTPDEARKKLTKAQALQDQGLRPASERDSVAKYLETWLAAQRQRLRPASYRVYGIMVHKYLIPELGRFKLARLTATQVDRAYARIREQGLSETSLRLLHRVLVKALGDATRRRELLFNVAPPW